MENPRRRSMTKLRRIIWCTLPCRSLVDMGWCVVRAFWSGTHTIYLTNSSRLVFSLASEAQIMVQLDTQHARRFHLHVRICSTSILWSCPPASALTPHVHWSHTPSNPQNMTPQLFINYKLQSVAHLNWRTMTYKSINSKCPQLCVSLSHTDLPALTRIIETIQPSLMTCSLLSSRCQSCTASHVCATTLFFSFLFTNGTSTKLILQELTNLDSANNQQRRWLLPLVLRCQQTIHLQVWREGGAPGRREIDDIFVRSDSWHQSQGETLDCVYSDPMRTYAAWDTAANYHWDWCSVVCITGYNLAVW